MKMQLVIGSCRNFAWRTFAAAAAFVFLLVSTGYGQQAEKLIAAGKALFEKQWAHSDAGSGSGDGLGPAFNHVSCIACHIQGGAGGGGPIDVNAALISVEVPRLKTPAAQAQFLRSLEAVHPGFVSDEGDITPNVILHRFGADARYAAVRERLVGATLPLKPTDTERAALQERITHEPVQLLSSAQPLSLVVTQRNTSALFGAGLIDAIPDAALHALAQAQSTHPEVSGRVAPVERNKAGRFGWRGQVDRLHDFVKGACANELGLEVPGNAQPMDPLRPEYKAPAFDLGEAECVSLTAFVASLPRPKMVPPADAEKRKAAEHGYETFKSIGCVACHVENIGPIEGIFSDLLLHDMGQSLADPALAQPTIVVVKQHLTSRRAVEDAFPALKAASAASPPMPQYYGGAPRISGPAFAGGEIGLTRFTAIDGGTTYVKTQFGAAETNLAQEWRTTPLWGVADSAPYLHDGRAESLVEAIALHGGEAEACTQRYLALPIEDRMAVLEFLSCLQAP